jgi:hypothetical protein
MPRIIVMSEPNTEGEGAIVLDERVASSIGELRSLRSAPDEFEAGRLASPSVRGLTGAQSGDVGRVDPNRTLGVALSEPRQTGLT